MSIEEIIQKKLQNAFTPKELEIINESHLHQSHANSPKTGESHFRIHMISDAFQGKSRIECHRMVNETLKEQLEGPVHALALKLSAP